MHDFACISDVFRVVGSAGLPLASPVSRPRASLSLAGIAGPRAGHAQRFLTELSGGREGQALNRNLSVFLDLLRLLAALLVLVGHMGSVYRMDLPDIVAHSAKEGVAIFFVLSGFVIAFVTTAKERDWASFSRARALRMYSVVPLAIGALLVCRAIGLWVNPDLYLSTSGAKPALGGALAGEAPRWLSILRYLTFTNEIWFDRAVITTGAPFWSLGFEAAYYVAFAILSYVRAPWRWPLLASWFVLCGPRIAVAFPLWLMGVAAWNLVRLRPKIGPAAGTLALAGLALGALAWRKWVGVVAAPLFEWPAPARAIASMAYYLELAVLVAGLVVVFAACMPERPIWPGRLERGIRYAAGGSFTLYIAHLPIMVLVVALWPASVGSLEGGFLGAGISVIAAYGLAELGERRKAWYAMVFSIVAEFFFINNEKKISAID
jgi:peptidoglycan/LPS O-acetylase OafA/YrhL